MFFVNDLMKDDLKFDALLQKIKKAPAKIGLINH